MPAWEPSAPFRNLFHWALGDSGLAFAHAAAVGTAAGGILLAGRGGAGKSTTAMACVHAGWRYVADDYCVLDVSGHPSTHTLYGSAKISPWALARLPELAHGEMRQRDDGKMVLNLAVSRPAQLVPRSLYTQSCSPLWQPPRAFSGDCPWPRGRESSLRALSFSCPGHGRRR